MHIIALRFKKEERCTVQLNEIIHEYFEIHENSVIYYILDNM